MYRHKLKGTIKGGRGYEQQHNTLLQGLMNRRSLNAINSAENSTKDMIKNSIIEDANATDYSDVITMETLPTPIVELSPRQAFYTEMECIPLEQALGRISGETITYYPPGIPCLGVGEMITEDVLLYIQQKQRDGYVPNGARDRQLQTILVCKDTN